MKNSCVFILTHGRANNVTTLKTLKKQGYRGDWYLVVDNEDECLLEYLQKFGAKRVLIFDKDEIEQCFDTMDNFSDRRTVVYARNVCFKLAESLGYRYFLELDDDYQAFEHRYIEDKKLKSKLVSNLDVLFDAMFQFLIDSNATCVALAQNGDYVSGRHSTILKKRLARKIMNTFFCDTQKPFTFDGRINEDVCTYVNSLDKVFLTITDYAIKQKATQHNKGGMTDTYIDTGTYVKSFYPVMKCPSCCKVSLMTGCKHPRIHHRITWSKAVPEIISSSFKKE